MNTCKYCSFKDDCEHREKGTVSDCVMWRADNEYDNGEEQ
jgi:2-iminoacetate synthase ThiH